MFGGTEKINTVVGRGVEIDGKRNHKGCWGQKKSNKPGEASTTNTDKKTGLALAADDTAGALIERLSAAYKSPADDLTVVQEPYLGI